MLEERRQHPGVEGSRGALSDWITPYERFRMEIDEAFVTDEDAIVICVRQIGQRSA